MSTRTTTVLETKVNTLENAVNGNNDVVQTLRNRVSELSDEIVSLKDDLGNTKTMIQKDLQTMMERISNRLNQR